MNAHDKWLTAAPDTGSRLDAIDAATATYTASITDAVSTDAKAGRVTRTVEAVADVMIDKLTYETFLPMFRLLDAGEEKAAGVMLRALLKDSISTVATRYAESDQED